MSNDEFSVTMSSKTGERISSTRPSPTNCEGPSPAVLTLIAWLVEEELNRWEREQTDRPATWRGPQRRDASGL